MEFLDLNKLQDLPNVPVKDIVIPEWKAKVKVKGLTKKMQVELARISTADDSDAFDYQKALLKASVIEPQLDDEAIEMLYEKDVFITPGTVFGSQGEGYIRFSLCVSEEKIKEAIKRFES